MSCFARPATTPIALLLTGTMLICGRCARGADVVIDRAQNFQTITGWGHGGGVLGGTGGAESMLPPSLADPVNYQYLDFITGELGLTGTRTWEVGPRIDGTGMDHGDCDVIDWNLFESDTLSAQDAAYLVYFQNRILAEGYQPNFYSSPGYPSHATDSKPWIMNHPGERAQQIMEQVREKQAASLADTVRDLQDIQKQLADMETRKRDEFQNFAKDFNKDAPARAEQAQAEAAKAQADALAVQTNTAATITNALATRANADLKQLDAQQRESIAAQNRATDAQERALEMLALSDKRFADAYKAQTEANAAQDLAAKTQIQAKSARDDAKNSKAKDRSSEIAGALAAITSFETAYTQVNDVVLSMSNLLANAQTAIASGNTNSPQALLLPSAHSSSRVAN